MSRIDVPKPIEAPAFDFGDDENAGQSLSATGKESEKTTANAKETADKF